MLCGWIFLVVILAAGYGLYVYPTHSWIVWGLLCLCAVCMLLQRRARTLFQDPVQSGVTDLGREQRMN